LIKLYWRFVMAGLTLMNPTDQLTLLNVGYADLGQPGGIIKDSGLEEEFDKYRLQLYHKVVLENGQIESLEGKTLLETGSGRGGGLNYLAQKLKPQYAIGIDMTYSMVIFYPIDGGSDRLLSAHMAGQAQLPAG